VTGLSFELPDVPTAEDESCRILRSRIDLSRLPPLSRDVTERVINASADFDYYTDLACDEESLAAGVAALARGAPVIADSAMVAAGISGSPVISKIADSLTTRLPAGFAGAAEVKDALRASGLRSVSNVSEKGGPAVAVAAFSALLTHALAVKGSRAGWGPAVTGQGGERVAENR
jgi:precorrin-8X/cobalt-precorrin-8 methylmutase